MKPPRTATALLPVFEVAGAIPTVVRDLAVAAYALRSRGITLDVLVLAERPDEATALAEKTAAELDLAVVTLTGAGRDVGAAFLAGFRHVVAEGAADLVITLDANGRHDATQIPHLVDRLVDNDLHVVVGSRWAPGSGTPGLSPGRWVLGRLANLAFRVVTGTRGIADASTSFRVVRTEVVKGFQMGDGPVTSHSVQTEFIALAVANGYRVGEAPIIYQPALDGGPGARPADVLSFLAHLRRLRPRLDRVRQRRLSPGGRHFADEHFGAAEDLERLGTARHFFDWVLDAFTPHLQGRVLEVGAGRGTITRKLVDRYPGVEVVALEPADNMYPDLASFAAMSQRVEAHRLTLAEYQPGPGDLFDAVVYLNVLEHVADDEVEVKMAAAALRPGGALLVFGPAHEWLYSELDYRAGHYRRYQLRRLRRIATEAGLEVVSCRYFDVLGVLPYFGVYRLMGRTAITGGSMWGYDRVVVPASRFLDAIWSDPPFGKNVLLVAVKR